MFRFLVDRWVQRLLVLSLAAVLVNAALSPSQGPAPGEVEQPLAAQPQSASVAWPPSTTLVVAEVVTRGAAASDQYVELYNAAAWPADLSGLELVYVTASGATVTRKQIWTDLILQPGQRLLLANAAGAYAELADGLFSGGFSTSGGSLVLRRVGAEVIDSLSWGTAASSFVEGSPGPAPATGWSLERRPGGSQGNGLDTNDNLADSRLEASPVPQGLSAPPVPEPTPTPATPLPPSPEPTPTPIDPDDPEPTFNPDDPEPTFDPDDPEPTFDPDDPEPTFDPDDPEPTSEANEPLPTATSAPIPSPTQLASPTPTTQPSALATPQPTPTPSPALSPTAQPAPTSSPTLSPTAQPSTTPSPTPTVQPSVAPSPAPLTIDTARGLPLGTVVTVVGRLTTPTGLTESGRGAFVQDDTAGIALYLAGADWPALPVGTEVTAEGALETRFSLLTIRLATAEALVVGEAGPSPLPLAVATGQVGETIEGRLVRVEGTISDGISTLTDGFSTAIDDGSGSLRVIVAEAAGISSAELPKGRALALTGVVGQRDTSGTGTAGYRLHLRSMADIEPLAPPATPSPAPSASPPPQASPSPTASLTPITSPSPSPTTAISDIARARTQAIGQKVTVRGVVTAPLGSILGDLYVALQDATGGLCVRLPAGAHPDVVPGRVIEVHGELAAPYGNLELRATPEGVRVREMASQPQARELTVAQLGEQTEGLLARLSGTIRRVEASSSGSLTLTLEDDSGQGRVFFFASHGVSRQEFSAGERIVATGIVADRLGLYRLWPRSRSDISYLPGGSSTETAAPSTGSGGAGGGGGAPSGESGNTPAVIAISEALRRQGQQVAVEGVVTVPNGLLDAEPRRVTVQDSGAAIMVRLPADAATVEVGQRLRLVGQVGTYYGAPQLTVSAPPVQLGRVSVSPDNVSSAPLAQASEWRLVRVSGRVESVRRSGDSWRAELVLPGGGVPIVGLARSGIPSTALTAGSQATVVGIVRRAYPTATDQRLAIVPRSASDIARGSPGSAGATLAPELAPGGGPAGSGGGPAGSGGDPDAPYEPGGSAATVPAVALADLAAHEGARVRVGGLIEGREGLRLLVADGSATAAIRLSGPAEAMLPLLARGLLIDVIGVVERTAGGGLEVHVDDPELIAYTSPLAAGAASAKPSSAPPDGPAAAAERAPLADDGPGRDWLLLLVSAPLAAMLGLALRHRSRWLPGAQTGLRRLLERLSELLPGNRAI